MTRVLLITPYGYENQGVRMLSAVLRREGFDAPILYMKAWRNNDIHPPTDRELGLFDRLIRQQSPDVIGIGFGTPYLRIVTELTRRARAVSDAHVIWGGVHPTISPEDCIDHADSVCIGEGELPLLDLAARIRDGEPVDDIANLWVRRDGGVVRNPPRPLIQDLDTLPYGHQLLGAEMFVIEDGKLEARDPSIDNVMYRIHASRGCPFQCAFCYNSQYREIYSGLGKYHRTRTVENVLQEIELARTVRPGLKRIRFDDDSFVYPRAWIEEFCREYPRRVGLRFDILLNPTTANERTLRMLHDVGLDHVQVGIQAGSDEEREKQYKRKGSNADTLALAQLLRDIGIDVTYDVILDNPLASRADKEAMLDLLLELPRPYNLFLYSLVVFPKSFTATTLMAAGVIGEHDIEGVATKSFEQFRLTLDYPRPAEDTFYACLISMASKGFIPRTAVRALARSETLRNHPTPLRYGAEAANAVKLGGVAMKMLRRGELSVFKLAEYASFRRRLIQ